MKRSILRALSGTAAVFLVIQMIPSGGHANPSIRNEPVWDAARTRELARRACLDCHSNETRWPWYSRIAPVSWRITNHVMEGREALNFSNGPSTREKASEVGEEARESVLSGEMPPWDYLLMHPEARLTEAERTILANGLEATLTHGMGRVDRAPKDRDGFRREGRDRRP